MKILVLHNGKLSYVDAAKLKGEKGDAPTREALLALIQELIPPVEELRGEPGRNADPPTRSELSELVREALPPAEELRGPRGYTPSKDELRLLMHDVLPPRYELRGEPGPPPDPAVLRALVQEVVPPRAELQGTPGKDFEFPPGDDGEVWTWFSGQAQWKPNTSGIGYRMRFNTIESRITALEAGGGGGYTDENARDAIGAALVAGAGISIVVDDPLNTITITNTGGSYTDEQAQDAVAILIQNGTGITWVYDDALNTLTPTVTLAPFSTTNLAEGTNLYFTNERVDDRVAALVLNGTGLTWTYDDIANTFTGNVSLTPFSTTNLAEGTNLYFTNERVDDRVAALVLNGTGLTWTYDDIANTFTGNVTITQYTDENAQDAIGAMIDTSLVYVDATPLLTRAALIGDVTAAQGGNATTIANDAVTFAKMQNIATDRLIGRDTALTGDPEEISLNATLEFTGAGAIQRAALTGDVTATAGGNATTIANDAVTFAKIQNITTDRLIGRDTAASGDPEEIALSTGLEFSGSASIRMTQNQRYTSITFVIDGGGATITAGVKGYLEIPFACTIDRVTLLADQTGSIVVDIWKDTYANYPPVDADSITAAAPPTITSSNKSQDATLTGWTTAITAGDILGFNVDSATTIQRLTISLRVSKT